MLKTSLALQVGGFVKLNLFKLLALTEMLKTSSALQVGGFVKLNLFQLLAQIAMLKPAQQDKPQMT